MELIDATPTTVNPSGNNGWCFMFGEGLIGHEVGAVYLLPDKQYYVRFRVIASPQPEASNAPPLPAYQPISERPLTAEEVEHFEALARELPRPTP